MLFITVQEDEKHDEKGVTLDRVRAATLEDLPRIKSFLGENGLPETGVDDWVRDFVIAEDGAGGWIGVAGLEIYGKSGLLRSVAVDKHHRGLGRGRDLVMIILEKARVKGVERVYLLTDNAGPYFEKLGFTVADRKDVNARVKTSREFTEACSDSAMVMSRATG
jgi:amino-acid N-acetyltransferase